MIPGANLLGLALSLISVQTAQLYKFTGRTANAAGYQEPSYAAPVNLDCSIQPIKRDQFTARGLNFEKSYVTIYCPSGAVDTGRDTSGDKIVFGGATYLCEEATPWVGQDGWEAVVAVKIS